MQDKTAYPITCQRCKQDFTVYAHAKDVDDFTSGKKPFRDSLNYLVGGDYSLFCSNLCNDCWQGLFDRK